MSCATRAAPPLPARAGALTSGLASASGAGPVCNGPVFTTVVKMEVKSPTAANPTEFLGAAISNLA